MMYGLVAGGLVLLFVGAEMLVRGAVALAGRLGVSPLLIGLTIVGFGTSTPELVVSADAALRGQPDIAVGNVVGSNTANILLILGLAALIYPLRCGPGTVFRDGSVMVASAALLALLGLAGGIAAWQGGLMLVALAGFVAYSFWRERRGNAGAGALYAHEAEEFQDIPLGLARAGAFVAAGLAALVLGSHLLVDGAVTLAATAGIPPAVIGLTLVAVGTSLPELATSIVAAWRRHADVAVGNVIGSNIFNVLGILGVSSLLAPLPVNPAMARLDVPVMLGVSLALLPFMATGWRLSRGEGAVLLAAYAVYVAFLYAGGRTF